MKKIEVVLPPTEAGEAVLVAPPAKKVKVVDTRVNPTTTAATSTAKISEKDGKKSLKRRITPVLMNNGAENNENTVARENKNVEAKGGDEIEKQVEKLSVDQDANNSTNSNNNSSSSGGIGASNDIKPKKKKRITPILQTN